MGAASFAVLERGLSIVYLESAMCRHKAGQMTATLLAILLGSTASRAIPPKVRVTAKGLEVERVSTECPIIYDNDWWSDIPDDAYLWAKASLGQCDLRANIVSRDMWEWRKGYKFSMDQCMKQCRTLLQQARASGLRSIPDPIAGSSQALQRPASGRIADTKFQRTPGSDCIVAEAKKATPAKPLLVFCGGPCTTVACAYLTDPSIAKRMIVFQIDGGGYNGKDSWSWQIVQQHCVFANWAHGYFWPKVGKWDPKRFDSLPRNPLCDALRKYARTGLAAANQWGDGPWILWLFDRRCLTSAKLWNKTAITVPKEGTNLKAMADEFFKTMADPAVYRSVKPDTKR